MADGSVPGVTLAKQARRLPPAVRALRPRQWLKNVLVFSAPLAAGSLLQYGVLARSLLAFVAFCLITGCIYLVNDIRDVGADRQHPSNRMRPIASGEMSISAAWMLALLIGAAGVVLGYLVSAGLGVTVSVYIVWQLAYSIFFKDLPIFDLAFVATGFMLRVIAGGAATGIHLSHWLLLVASFGSLFMVSGKRYAEVLRLGTNTPTRRSLAGYTDSFLRFVWMLSAGIVLIFYGLWAAANTDRGPLDVDWTVISIAPFTLALLQYARRIDTGNAGAPEDIVIRDRTLLTFGGIWLILICIAVFA
jgi:decaprenyl-phosphate phosphoribosyltransferase